MLTMRETIKYKVRWVCAGKKIMTLDLQANSQTHNDVFAPIKREGFPLSFVRKF